LSLPIAKGLSFLHVGGCIMDAVGKRRGIANGADMATSIVYAKEGRAYRTDASGNRDGISYTDKPGLEPTLTKGYTHFFYGRVAGTVVQYAGLMQRLGSGTDYATYGYLVNPDGNNQNTVVSIFGSSTGTEWSGYVDVGDSSKPFLIATTRAPNGTVKTYLNGILVDTTSGIATQSTYDSGSLYICSNTVADAYLAGLWHRVLSDAEVYTLSKNPWQLFNNRPATVSLGHMAYIMSADSGSFALSGKDATLLKTKLLDGLAGSFALAGQAVTSVRTYVLTAASGAFAFVGQIAGLLTTKIFTAAAGSYDLVGKDSAGYRDFYVWFNGGAFSLAGQDIEIGFGERVVSANSGAFNSYGQAASLLYFPLNHYVLTGDFGEFDYVVDTEEAYLLHDGILVAGSDSYAYTAEAAYFFYTRYIVGDAANLSADFHYNGLYCDRFISADDTAFLLAGNEIANVHNKAIVQGDIAFSVQPSEVSLLFNQFITGINGNFSQTGYAATLLKDSRIDSGNGAFSIAINPGLLKQTRTFAVESATYTYGGQVVGLHLSKGILAGSAVYSLSDMQANTYRGRYLAIPSGNFGLAGQPSSGYKAWYMASVAGVFNESFKDAALEYIRRLTAGSASYSLAFTGKLLSTKVLPSDAGAVSLLGQITGLLSGRKLDSREGYFVSTANAGGLFFDKLLAGYSAGFALAGKAADSELRRGLVGDSGAMALAGQIAALLADKKLSAVAAAGFSVAMQQIAGLAGRQVTGSGASMELSLMDAGLWLQKAILAGNGSFSEVVSNADLIKLHELAAGAGHYVLSGKEAPVLVARFLELAEAVVDLAGKDSTLGVGRYLSGLPGDLMVSGSGSVYLYGQCLQGNSGQLAWAAAQADLIRSRFLAGVPGAFDLLGQIAGAARDRCLSGGRGEVALTGSALTFLLNQLLSASGGAVALTPRDANLYCSRLLVLVSGELALAGNAVDYVWNRYLMLSGGVYDGIGQDAFLLRDRIIEGAATDFSVDFPDIYFVRGKFIVLESGEYIYEASSAEKVFGVALFGEGGLYELVANDISAIRDRILPVDSIDYLSFGNPAALVIDKTNSVYQLPRNGSARTTIKAKRNKNIVIY
jgi:hypothetical protein